MVVLAEDEVRGEIAGCPRPEEGWCLGTESVEQVGELCSLDGVEEHSRHTGSVAKPATASRLPERGHMPSTHATRKQTTLTTVEMAAVDQVKIRLLGRPCAVSGPWNHAQQRETTLIDKRAFSLVSAASAAPIRPQPSSPRRSCQSVRCSRAAPGRWPGPSTPWRRRGRRPPSSSPC